VEIVRFNEGNWWKTGGEGNHTCELAILKETLSATGNDKPLGREGPCSQGESITMLLI